MSFANCGGDVGDYAYADVQTKTSGIGNSASENLHICGDPLHHPQPFSATVHFANHLFSGEKTL